MNKPFELSASGLIDFEVLKPELVAAALKEPEAEAIVTDPLSIDFGRTKGSKQAVGERMLAGSTIDWLLAIEPALRPKRLCERYPHVANRLAGAWTNEPASIQSLQQLEDDARWGSTGYPAQVQTELQRLLQALRSPG